MNTFAFPSHLSLKIWDKESKLTTIFTFKICRLHLDVKTYDVNILLSLEIYLFSSFKCLSRVGIFIIVIYCGNSEIKTTHLTYLNKAKKNIYVFTVTRPNARHIGTRTNRHQDKSAPSLTNRHFGKILIYFHIYSTFSKK